MTDDSYRHWIQIVLTVSSAPLFYVLTNTNSCMHEKKGSLSRALFITRMLVFLVFACFLVASSYSVRIPLHSSYSNGAVKRDHRRQSPYIIAAVLPGDPLITGTLSQGAITTVGLFSNVILARLALSWFPQVLKQFPFLKPVITGIILHHS